MYFLMIVPIAFIIMKVDFTFSKFIMVYLQERDLVLYIDQHSVESFQLRRLQKLAFGSLLCLFIPMSTNPKLYSLFILAANIIIYKNPYWSLKRTYQNKLSLIRFQFPIWIRQIQVLLNHNNVTNTLKKSVYKSPSLIKDELYDLVDILEDDPTNYYHYINFMRSYNLVEINRTMKILFQCQIMNHTSSIQQLNTLVETTASWLRQERHYNHERKFMKLEWLGMIPLIGVTVVFIGIMFNLLNNLLGKG